MKNQKINHQSIIFKLLFILAVVLLFSSGSIQAATSPDAIAFRVMPNPDHLSPRRWYQENIKLKGSPQGLTVDGYEAVRDGRTVYVNAANIDLNNRYCSKDQSISCNTSDIQCVSAGGVCVPKFYTNIYIISYNQQAESATVDIFGQILAYWKFNTNIPPDPEDSSETVAKSCLYSSECPSGEYCLSQKAKIIRDTKRLADLADIELVLDNYQEAHSGDYPALSAGSYVAGKSLSVWPSWQATLAKELGVTLSVDPVNRLASCPAGYDQTTCWNQTLKKFAGIPANSHAYVYTYNGKKSYNLCALMESGYLTTLQGACAGSAVGYKVTCVDDATAWTPKYNPANVCKGQKIVETSNCGNTRDNVLVGTKIATAPNCAASTCVGQKCDTGCGMVDGAKCCPTCNASGQPNCKISDPGNSTTGTGTCCDGKKCYKCQNGYIWNGTTCACAPKTQSQACGINNCGNADNGCGGTISCGICAGQKTCSVTSGAGTCACVPESNEEFCLRLRKDCGSVTADDNCGKSRTVNSCGTCIPPQTCGANKVCACSATCNNNASSQPNCKTSASVPANSETSSVGICCGAGEACYKCKNNYTWNNTTCAANTRTALCTGLPAIGAEWWNGVSTVNQTYDGFNFSPSEVVGVYDKTTPGDCKYKCKTGYKRVDNACVPCTINCAGKICGDDTCDGSCGTCGLDEACTGGLCCPKQAEIQVCADNCHETYFNGKAVSSACDWKLVQNPTVDVQPGDNVIAIKASNWTGWFGFSATLNRVGCYSMTTDDISNWKCKFDPSPGFNPGSDWVNVDFVEDSTWLPPVLGNPGSRGSDRYYNGNKLDYQQIWAQGATQGVGLKATSDYTTVYCRYTFTAD